MVFDEKAPDFGRPVGIFFRKGTILGHYEQKTCVVASSNRYAQTCNVLPMLTFGLDALKGTVRHFGLC